MATEGVLPDQLPPRFFAVGHEPIGMRVNAYNPRWRLDQVLQALDTKEVERVKKSFLGRFIDKMDKPGYSGRFGHFLLTRQLKVSKKNEAWFLFAGKPIRFALREFEIVTGLPCGKYPVSKKRNRCLAGDKPYWGDLFGRAESIYVDLVINMLRSKEPADPDIRFKYACLAIVDGFIMPTNHNPKISKEHAELIADEEAFLSYPWGRAAFEMTISSIKDRDALAINQSTVAIKGFFYAVQLVMAEAVPALLEAPVKPGTKYSQSEDDDQGPCKPKRRSSEMPGKQTLDAGNARDVDDLDEVVVDCILPDEGDLSVGEHEDMGWADEVEDDKVEFMKRLVGEDFDFKKEMFSGGCTGSDLELMKAQKEKEKAEEMRRKEKGKRRKRNPTIIHDHTHSPALSDEVIDKLATMVASTINHADRLPLSDEVIDKLATMVASKINLNGVDFYGFEGRLMSGVASRFGELEKVVLSLRNTAPFATKPAGPPSVNQTNPLPSESESDERESSESDEGELQSGFLDPILDQSDVGISLCQRKETVDGVRKSKRPKIPSTKIGNDFQCGPTRKTTATGQCGGYKVPDLQRKIKVLLAALKKDNVFSRLDGSSFSTKDITNIMERTKYMSNKMVHLLIKVVCKSVMIVPGAGSSKKAVFLDTKFTSSFMKVFSPSFKNADHKEDFEFPAELVSFLSSACANYETPSPGATDFFYLPFNFDKKRWVFICLSTQEHKLFILDPDCSSRTDTQLKKDMLPIAVMFPYLLSQADSSFVKTQPMKMERVGCAFQSHRTFDSPIIGLMMVHAHLLGGVECCCSLVEASLPAECQKLAVLCYEEIADVV